MTTNHEHVCHSCATMNTSCSFIRGLFPAYATIVALGHELACVYPHVAAHLDYCCACRAAVDELVEILVTIYTGQLASSSTSARVDLSFLRAQECTW